MLILVYGLWYICGYPYTSLWHTACVKSIFFIPHVIHLFPRNSTGPIADSMNYETCIAMYTLPPSSLISLQCLLKHCLSETQEFRSWSGHAALQLVQLIITVHFKGRQPHYFLVHFAEPTFYSVTELPSRIHKPEIIFPYLSGGIMLGYLDKLKI